MKNLFSVLCLVLGVAFTSACTSNALVGFDQDGDPFTDVQLSSSGDDNDLGDWTPPSDGNCPVFKAPCLPPDTPTNDDFQEDKPPIEDNPWAGDPIDYPYGCPAYKQFC